jgi:beta-lactamase class D
MTKRGAIVKKLLSLLLLLVLAVVGSWFVQENRVYSQNKPQIEQKIDFRRHFDNLGVNGSIIIYDLDRDRFDQHNPSRNNAAFLPASTYKIPNSLIALETGVIKDDVAVLTWDGIERGSNETVQNWTTLAKRAFLLSINLVLLSISSSFCLPRTKN